MVPDQGAGGNPVLCRYVPKWLPGDEGLVDFVALIVGANRAAPWHGLGHIVHDDSQGPAKAPFGLGVLRVSSPVIATSSAPTSTDVQFVTP